MQALLFRDKTYCNSVDFQFEVKKIFSDLIENDYPKNWLLRVLNEFLYPRISNCPIPSAQPPKKIFISAPYYFGLSESLSRQLIKFNIFVSHVPSRSLRSLICNFKPFYPPLDSIGVIYSIPCKNCDGVYIGQTGRKLRDRINEHQRAYKIQDLNSKLFQHSMDFNHIPNFSGFKVLISNCKILSKRLFIESFLTKLSKYSINEATDIPSEYVIFT